MKTPLLLLTSSTVLLVAGAHTASALDFGVSGFGSYYDADKAGEAYGGGALVRMGIFDWLAADARLSRLEFDDTDLEVTPIEVAGLARIALFDERLVPYGGVGVGYYLFDDSNQANVDDGYGFFPVVGLDWRFGAKRHWSVFAEVRWLVLDEDFEVPGVPSSDDIDGVAVNAGVGFKF